MAGAEKRPSARGAVPGSGRQGDGSVARKTHKILLLLFEPLLARGVYANALIGSVMPLSQRGARKMEKSATRLKFYLAFLLFIIATGSVVFAKLENLSLLDALYFSIVTIATVGYGDIHPTTLPGKLVAVALIIGGVGTFLEVIAGITQTMIKRRDKEIRDEKLNMMVGLFFSEMGARLLKSLAQADPDADSLVSELSISAAWTEQQFQEQIVRLTQFAYKVDADRVSLADLQSFLREKGDFLLRLLENPTLLEQESFTELLRAIFHLRDELINRDRLADLPKADKKHLVGDMERIYKLLARQWLIYMKYLKKNYPYLFSLALRTNPFDSQATPVIYE